MALPRNRNIPIRQDMQSQAGPASYLTASKPTITFGNLRAIESVQDVVITVSDAGYIAEVVSISGNVVTFIVRSPTNVAAAHTHVFTGAALGTHTHAVTGVTFTGALLAGHQHDITTVVAAGGGGAVTDPLVPGPLESAGGGQVNTNAVDAGSGGTPAGTIGGTADAITAGTPAGTNASAGAIVAAVAAEVADTTVLNGVTFLGVAMGR